MKKTTKKPKEPQTPAESESLPVQEKKDGKDKAQPSTAKYSTSGGFSEFLLKNKISIAISSYQSGRLYLLGRNPKGGLMVNEQNFARAMGLCVQHESLFMVGRGYIYRLENILRKDQWINETFTNCFVPRTSHLIGDLDAHDLGINKDGSIVFVNTKYNCLASLSDVHSFKEVWRPSFISKLVKEDRCHLNGLAMQNGEAAFTTAVSRSDTIDGWRDRRENGGVVIDVKSNDIICSELSMPHSPRIHNERLWVLNSGLGEIGYVDREKGVFESIAFCPGFLRGLAFFGDYAFVGLSRPRYERFEGLGLDKKLRELDSEPWTGIQVIDIRTGACVHWFRIDGGVAELYDVAVLPNVICAKSVAPGTDETLALVTIAS